MNSFHNSLKYLRILNLKPTLNTLKECSPKLIQIQKPNLGLVPKPATTIYFSPHSIGLEIKDKNVTRKIKQDPLTYTPIINPRSILPLIDTWRKDEIGLPAIQKEEKHAHRMLIIRRKKMKKHQRKKLFKKMRHKWARVKKNRRIKKEKLFQNELILLVKAANEFSAEEYVASKLEKVNHTPLPRHLRNSKLPDFIIRQMLGLDKKVNYRHTDVYKA